MVAMLGDLKGVKYLIETKQLSILEFRISTINEIFTKAFLLEKNRSRSLTCYCFSDSILALWHSDYEGKKYASEFALSIWTEIAKCDFPYRIFIDIGDSFDDTDNYSYIVDKHEKRFKKIFPVSVSVWSVFLAETSRSFPNGVYVGEALSVDSNELIKFDVNPFTYYKIA